MLIDETIIIEQKEVKYSFDEKIIDDTEQPFFPLFARKKICLTK